MKRHKQAQKGVAIAEAAAALCVLLPIAVLIVFVILEASYAYLIKHAMSEAARVGARNLAIAYGTNPAVADSRSLQNAMVFDHIRMPNMVNNSAQFDDPVFDTTSDPAMVKVNIQYLSARYGLPPFPQPDPLNLGGAFVISADSTYRLE